MLQQIVTFEELYNHIKDNGIYLCEDTHTSYMYAYHGGYKKKGTFIEYSKNFIDHLHAWHSEDKRLLGVNNFTKSAYGIHFYTGMVIIEKRQVTEPKEVKRGKMTVGYVEYHAQKKQTVIFKIKWKIKKILGRV
jgi:hypothetical protein